MKRNDDAERADVHQSIDEQIEDDADVAVSVTGDETQEQIARVRDRRISQEPLGVRLCDRSPVADEDRDGSDETELRGPICAHAAERLDEDAHVERETRRFRAG